MSQQSPYYDSQTKQTLLVLNLLIAVAAVASVILILLSIIGSGTVRLSLPSNATVRINGHAVSSNRLSMLPGDYHVIISSPTIAPYQGTLSVGLFQTTMYSPKLQLRDPESIASSLLGGEGQSGALRLGLSRWFDNNTWFAGLVGPNIAELAMHFDATQNRWTVIYYSAPGYPQDVSKLPSAVAAYIEQLESQHAQG